MKTHPVLLILVVVAATMMAAAASHSDARATSVSSAMSGGQYVLTIRLPTAPPLTGYRLVDPGAAAVDPASGCCCKGYLPCVLKK